MSVMYGFRRYVAYPRMPMVSVVPGEELLAEKSGILERSETSWKFRLEVSEGGGDEDAKGLAARGILFPP